MKYPAELDQWIVKYLQDKLDAASKEKLNTWLEESPENRELFQRLCSEEHWKEGVRKMASFDENRAWRAVLAKSGRVDRGVWRYWAGAAAVAVLLISIGVVMRLELPRREEVAQTIVQKSGIRLKVANGESFQLDSVQYIETAGMMVKNSGRQLVIEEIEEAEAGKPVEWNTIEVPQGSDYSLVLSDGTSIFLNAETTLRFPNGFGKSGNREVWMDGEGYFEVARDVKRPFIVHSSEVSVKVLGTAFNVMAYRRMPTLQVTLVNGKVEIEEKEGGNKMMLEPGVQAIYCKQGRTLEKKAVEVDYYTAWHEGIFAFRESTLEEVLETLGRWYGFEVFFQNAEVRDYVYTGKIKRHSTLREVLNHFSLTDEFDFEIRDRTVIIKTKS
ncbi:MAG: DUF4974 domain-containing protein [Odoribacter sp.]